MRPTEYDRLYNYDIKDEIDEEIDKENAAEILKNTISRGDCPYCNGKLTMEYEGNICFICSNCDKALHEDLYYVWAAGYEIEEDNA